MYILIHRQPIPIANRVLLIPCTQSRIIISEKETIALRLGIILLTGIPIAVSSNRSSQRTAASIQQCGISIVIIAILLDKLSGTISNSLHRILLVTVIIISCPSLK